MGVFGGRDNFSSKWITAMIFDSENRLHLVPIKHNISGHFLAEINNDTFAFKIDHSRIGIWYATLTKSFRVLLYTTAHYMPVSPQNNKELELVLQKNSLPKMDKLSFLTLQQLARREKKEFKPHTLKEIIAEINKHPDKETDVLQNIKKFLTELNTDKIVTPVRHIMEFIYDDLIKTDPDFLGSVLDTMMKAEEENRKVTNSPIGTKRSYWKVIAIVAIISVVGVISWMLYDSGAIQNFIGGFTNWTGGAFKTSGGTDWMSQYTPESLKAAVDSGKVSMSSLPPDIQGLIKNVKIPSPPTSQSINLTP